MCDFIVRANKKDKSLQAYFLRNGIQELTDTIGRMTDEGVKSVRFVVNIGRRDGRMCYHFCAFDYKVERNGKASLIGVDPAIGIEPAGDILSRDRRPNGPAIMRKELETTFRTKFPDTAVIFMETGIQKSTVDCGMFSLAFVKKMAQEKSAFDDIHQNNIAGQWREHFKIAPKEAYELLPPSFLKHAHAKSTLEAFLEVKREARDESSKNGWIKKLSAALQKDPMKQTVTNKKRDENGKKFTLEGWHKANEVTRRMGYREITFSRSIEFKRQNEISKLLQLT
jgi:YopJ protease family